MTLFDKICHFSGLETANDEIQKRISDAFEVFDHEHNNTVDLREIGTIIRSLGIFTIDVTAVVIFN